MLLSYYVFYKNNKPRFFFFFFSSRRRHTRFKCDWSSDVCSSDLLVCILEATRVPGASVALTERSTRPLREQIATRLSAPDATLEATPVPGAAVALPEASTRPSRARIATPPS